MRGPKKVRKLAAEELFNYAVQCLGRRAFAADELKAKLYTRAAQPSDIDAAIIRLKDIGYLNDQRFAESFAVNRAENDGFGRMRVLADLRSHRVPAKLAETAVAKVFENKAECDQIDAFIDRKMPSLRARGKIEEQKELLRAWNRLRRAGFSSGGSMAALKRLAANPELIEAPFEEEAFEDQP